MDTGVDVQRQFGQWAREVVYRTLSRVAPGVFKWSVRHAGTFRSRTDLWLLPALAPRGREALDVGAHRGLFSIFLEPIVGSARLHVFEPLPEFVGVLRTLFPSAHVHDCALSREEGDGVLWVPVVGGRTLYSRSSLEPLQFREGSVEGVGSRLEVQVRRLDSLLVDGVLSDVGFVKIDVEGHEVEVLRGAEVLVRAHKPNLLVEIEQRHHEYPIADVFSFVMDLGYEIFWVDNAVLALRGIGEFDTVEDQDVALLGKPKYVNNFLAIPSGDVRAVMSAVRDRLRELERLRGRKRLASSTC